MKFRLFVAVLAIAGVVMTGCSPTEPTSPDPTFQFVAPADGQVLKIGDTVTLSWDCTACDGFRFQLHTYTDSENYFDISPSITGRSYTWVVGTTRKPVALLPANYRIAIEARFSEPYTKSYYWNRVYGPVVRLVN